MYAVIAACGKQYRVVEGDTLKLEKLEGEIGDTIDFETVLMVADGDNVQVGIPTIAESKVSATVLRHGRDKKIKIVKFRRRKNSRRQMGHRQSFTEVRIEAIQIGGAAASAAKAAKPKKASEKPTANPETASVKKKAAAKPQKHEVESPE